MNASTPSSERLRVRSRAIGIALVLFYLAACYWPLNSGSGSELQFVGHELVWSSLWHAALVIPVLFLPWLTGIWVVHCAFKEKRLDAHWIALMGYLLSIPISVLWIVLALMIPGGVLLILPTVVLGGMVVKKQEAFFFSIKKNAWGCFSFLLFSLIFGALFGVMKHGPSEELWARPHGDFAFYASAIHSVFAASSFPVADLSLEGNTLYGFNLLFPAIGAALLTILPLDGFLFLGATGSSYFILSAVLCLLLVIKKNDGLGFSSVSLWQKNLLQGREFLYEVNIFFHVIEVVRAPILEGVWPFKSILIMLVVTLLIACFLSIVEERYRKSIVYWI